MSCSALRTDAVWEETRETTSRDIYEAYAIMRSALRIPIYGTIGNQWASSQDAYLGTWAAC